MLERRRAIDALPARNPLRRAADLWWLHPTLIILLIVVPVYLSVLGFDFRRVVQNVYVPSALYLFGLLLILCVPVGIQWALASQPPTPARQPPRISRTVMLMLLLPALLAYALWFGPLLAKPDLLLELVRGQRPEVRDTISTLPGVTTFTQLGVAYAIAYAIKSGAGIERLSAIERFGFWLLLGLAVFRAFVWAERLAVIEFVVCFLVARLAYLPVSTSKRWRFANIAPVLAPLVLYLIFTASEYFRSWEFYSNQYDSIWAFTLDRLITYYATAVNNGIGMLTDNTRWPYLSGAFVVEWPFRMPGLAKVLEAAVGNPRDDFLEWLSVFARPEFNSSTAYFRSAVDLGYAGSVLFFIATGFFIGRAYAGFRRGFTYGLLVYPVFVLAMIESLRYSYFGESRIVPLAVGLIMVGLDMRRLRVRGHESDWARPLDAPERAAMRPRPGPAIQ